MNLFMTRMMRLAGESKLLPTTLNARLLSENVATDLVLRGMEAEDAAIHHVNQALLDLVFNKAWFFGVRTTGGNLVTRSERGIADFPTVDPKLVSEVLTRLRKGGAIGPCAGFEIARVDVKGGPRVVGLELEVRTKRAMRGQEALPLELRAMAAVVYPPEDRVALTAPWGRGGFMALTFGVSQAIALKGDEVAESLTASSSITRYHFGKPEPLTAGHQLVWSRTYRLPTSASPWRPSLALEEGDVATQSQALHGLAAAQDEARFWMMDLIHGKTGA